jgi:hypothetical protein
MNLDFAASETDAPVVVAYNYGITNVAILRGVKLHCLAGLLLVVALWS